MNPYFFTAGCLALLLGLFHSYLGERLIFRRMRNGSIVPTAGRPILRERYVRILWVSWHLVTVLGWSCGAILLLFALPSSWETFHISVKNAILAAMVVASVFVLVGTKGKHPAWVILLIISVLIWIG